MSTTIALLLVGAAISATLFALSWRRANRVIALAEAEQRAAAPRRAALAEIAELDPPSGEFLAALAEPAPELPAPPRDGRQPQ